MAIPRVIPSLQAPFIDSIALSRMCVLNIKLYNQFVYLPALSLNFFMLSKWNPLFKRPLTKFI